MPESNNKSAWYENPRFWIIISPIILIAFSVMVWLIISNPRTPYSIEIPFATPITIISTTINHDGTSGSIYFQAVWNLNTEYIEEAYSPEESANITKEIIEYYFDTKVTIWRDDSNALLVLGSAINYNDPIETEFIFKIICGEGYCPSYKILGLEENEFKKMWKAEITINPNLMPHINEFKWIVNMPGEIKDVQGLYSDSIIRKTPLDINSLELTFEPTPMTITFSITAEEFVSNGFISPILVGIISGVSSVIILGILAIFWRRIKNFFRNTFRRI